jgi:hypothetical protein
MKAIFLFLITGFLILSLIYSCSSSQSENTDNKIKTEKYTDHYTVITDKSVINWSRIVDNKLIKKKVKLFGSYMDVNMENVTFNSDGTLLISGGEITKSENIWLQGFIEIPLTTFKFYNEEEEQFFTEESLGIARLDINEIIQDTSENLFTVKGILHIADSANNISFPVEIYADSLNFVKAKGEFVLYTLDWPFRKNADRQNVRKDEITLKLDLCFEKTKTDTITE